MYDLHHAVLLLFAVGSIMHAHCQLPLMDKDKVGLSQWDKLEAD